MRIAENNVLKSVLVNRQELLKTIKANKEAHIKEYEESLIGYNKLVLEVCEMNVRVAQKRRLRAKAGNTDFKDLSYELNPVPIVSHEAEYTKAISMLEMSVEDNIELEAIIFNQLVLDEWKWKEAFFALATEYKSAI